MTLCFTDVIQANYSDIKLREHWDSQYSLLQNIIFDESDSYDANLMIEIEGLPKDSSFSFNTHHDTRMNVAGIANYNYESSYCSSTLNVELNTI